MDLRINRKTQSTSFDVFDDSGFLHSYDGIVIDDDRVIDEEIYTGDLKITGSARFMEIADADSIEIEGTAEFRTFATCDDLNVLGSAIFKDELTAENVVIRGGATVNGKVNSDLLIVEGKMRANSKVNALSVSISGYMNCLHRLSFDKCHVRGVLVSADVVKGIDIKFKSSDTSNVKRIVADDIEASGIPTKGAYILICDEADCGKAKIEHTKIDHLICDDCVIGKGCRIGILECRSAPTISRDAFVEKIIKL